LDHGKSVAASNARPAISLSIRVIFWHEALPAAEMVGSTVKPMRDGDAE
jgi:hypothetical protein